jgi:hypothetical protein
MPKLMGYEGCVCTLIPPGVSHTKRIIRAGLGQDLMFHPSFYEIETENLNVCEQPGPTGTEGLDVYPEVSLNLNVGGGNDFYVCADGSDGSFTQLGFQTYGYQGQPSGGGLSNQFWSSTSGIGGDGNSHIDTNQTVAGKARQDFIDAGPINGLSGTSTVSFTVRPGRIPPSCSVPITLTLTGTGTSWTSGSTIVVTNSLTGTTAVTARTWTAISSTSATLTVTTGRGDGSWKLTIDSVDSPTLRVGSGARWFSGLNRRAPLRSAV